MQDETFLAFVTNNAPRCELETLEKAIKTLADNIASRRWGRPPGLEIGSRVEAVEFEGALGWYGTVKRFTPQGCILEPPTGTYTTRVSFKKYVVRILDETEWNRVCFNADEREKKFSEKSAQENAELETDRQHAIRERAAASLKAKSFQALNGEVELFRGAFVHAYRPDWGVHVYGVMVDSTPKSLILTSPESTWVERVRPAKHEIRVLSEDEWTIVDAELRRRRAEYEVAEKAGKTSDLPDYATIEITLM
jgi:hypothetical protein